MYFARSFLALSVACALHADTWPISTAFIDAMKAIKTEVKTTDSPKTINVLTPIREVVMLGGSVSYDTMSNNVKDILERQCFAYGGDVYFNTMDSFGDTVEAHSFDHEKVKGLSETQRHEYAKIDPNDRFTFIKSRGEFRDFFTDQRLKKAFIGSTDVLRSLTNFDYDTTCKAIDTGKVIYTAKTKPIPDELLVTFADTVPQENFAKPKISKMIESLFTEYVMEQKGNKYLIKNTPFTNQTEIARAFCEEASGKLIVDGSEANIYSRPVMMRDEMGCAEIEHPFVFRVAGPFKYMLLTDTVPNQINGTQTHDKGLSDIEMRKIAFSTAMLPLGAQSENNIGNRKLISTVYSETGTMKLINVQEAGGNNKTYKNYRVQNNEAHDITDNQFVYSNLQLPQSIVNAKGSLVQQCSQYGAGKVSIDGYTATCSRQAYGNQCNVNLIYMRIDQFAGRETVGCR